MIEKEIIDWTLEFSNRLKSEEPVSCNPLTQFIPYVYTKEIVHTKILSDLLSRSGTHEQGKTFIKGFVELIGLDYNDNREYQVFREKKVSRVLTSGNPRSIDILITYKDDQDCEHAIIVENKLNHAEYQNLQIEDYIKGIELEGIIVDRIVLLHDLKQYEVNNKDGVIVKYLYPDVLAQWIRSSTSDANILAYADYLRTLNNQNINLNNAKMMTELSLDELKMIKKVVDAYNKLKEAFQQKIVEDVQKNLSFPIDSISGKLDEGCEALQIWNKDDYNINGVWIALFQPGTPANDESGNDLYLYAKDDKSKYSDVVKLAKDCKYKLLSNPEGFLCFVDQNDNFRYYILDDNNKNNYEALIAEIVRLLNILHNP